MAAPGASDLVRVTGAILAGGAAQRMQGRDKGLLQWRGKALVQTALLALRGQVDDVLIVANRNQDNYAAYAPVVSDRHPGFRGPMEGIASALFAVQTQYLLVVPVDCPQPPRGLASRLGQAIRGNVLAAVAHDGTRRQPLFAFYDTALLPSAELAAAENRAVWRWQDDIGVREVDFSDCAAQFANLNVPADFFEEGMPLHD